MFIIPVNGNLGVSPIETISKQKVTTDSNIPFKDVFENAYKNLVETQETANADAYRLSMGEADDLHNIMINSQKAETALNMTVQLTSRAINAYNEIMRMQV